MFHVSFFHFSSFRFFAAAKVIYVMYFIVVIVGTFPQYNLENREGVRCTIYCYTFHPLIVKNKTVCLAIYNLFLCRPPHFHQCSKEAGGRFHSCQPSSKEADGLAKFFIFPRKGLEQEWADRFVSSSRLRVSEGSPVVLSKTWHKSIEAIDMEACCCVFKVHDFFETRISRGSCGKRSSSTRLINLVISPDTGCC